MTWLATLMNRWVQLAAGTALGVVFGFALGHHQKTLEDASAALRGAEKTIVVVKAQGSVNSTVDQHTIQATAQTQANTNANLQRIPLYITRKADDQCVVARSVVSLLNANALDIPAPAVSLPDANSGVAITEIVADDTINSGSYHSLAERLKAWDEWYDGQSKVALTR